MDRVAVAAVLDGTVPAVGPEATDGGVTDVARHFNPGWGSVSGVLCSSLLQL